MIFMIIEVLAVSYFIAFAVLVVRGREREWPNEFGFLYSRDEVRNRALGQFFLPIYTIARTFGIQRLCHPYRMLQ
jgi:hypothetical protein